MNKYSDPDEEFEQPIDFIGIFIKYFSYWKWFVATIAICLIIAVVKLKFTLPNYEVKTSVLLKDDQKGGGGPEVNAFKELGLFTQKNNVDNELEMLKTSTLVEQVVRELGIYTNYTHIGTFQLVKNLGIDKKYPKIGTFKDKILYGSECPILVRLPDTILDNMTKGFEFEILVHPYGEYEFSGTYQDKMYKVKASISDNQVILPFGKIYIARGKFRPTEDMLIDVDIQNPMNKAAQMLGGLKMELTSKTTSVADITLKTSNVQLGKDFLNKLVEVYNREDMDDQAAMANKTAQFIDNRLMTLTKELGDVESQAESYKQAQGLTDIQSQANLFIQQTGNFDQKRLDVETQLAIVSDIDDYMHKKENKYQLLPTSAGMQSAGLSELINNYNKLILERNRLSRIASSSNQAMIDLTSQISSMFSTVQSSVRNEKNNLLITQKDLLSKNSENAAHIRAIPRQEREYTEIKRQQGVKEGLFLYLLQKKEEKYLNMSVVEPIAKIIDNPGSSGSPVSPRKSMILIIALIIGFVIPVVGVKIRDLLRYQIENKEELEALSIVPVLGEISKTEVKENVIVKENSTDSFTELVRLLRTNLLFVLDSAEKKVINVVSSVSGEGKTFVALNLAMSLALLDKKVLVIGLDVRKPKLAENLSLNNETGITLFLTGHLTKDQLIRPSGIHPNLSVITSGPIPPNPNELLAKPALDKLITELRDQYDYIIIDSAPIGIVSDGFTLNRFADVSLYIVRANFTAKRSIEDASNLFIGKKLKNMYFVLNDVDNNRAGYRYGLGKKYEYGYGNEGTKNKK
ncbi:MAG: polysaccharide biosynthesis tyrosine autokinase [Paludibacter sp.]|nr:polysaccharide biosynthesis tyrosine autokinase [Paludibacter sp.]